MIDVKNLHKSFGNHEVLKGVNEHIEKGEKDEAARVVSRHIENQAQAVTDVIRTKKN